jgi:hypothetical protein
MISVHLSKRKLNQLMLFFVLHLRKRCISIYIDIIFLLIEGNNQTSSIKDKQTKDSGIIQDPNIIGRELFVSEIKEFYPAVHIKYEEHLKPY